MMLVMTDMYTDHSINLYLCPYLNINLDIGRDIPCARTITDISHFNFIVIITPRGRNHYYFKQMRKKRPVTQLSPKHKVESQILISRLCFLKNFLFIKFREIL